MANNNGRFFPVQTLHLGATGQISTFNESTLSNNGIGPFLGQLGMIIEDSGNCYRLVQFDDGSAVASAAGGCAHWLTRASFIVTSDASAGEAGGVNDVAGGFLGIQTDQYYCFIQVGGLQSLIGDGSIAKGDIVVGDSADLGFDTIAAATELGVAVAYADDSGSPARFAAYWNFSASMV